MVNCMDNFTLRKVQLIQLEIAKEIDRVCKENNINYYLIGGSLLGAIRHKGFIPWDDDLDIGMLRKDYEKFIAIAPKVLQDKYKIIHWKSDLDYPLPMGKVIKKGTLYMEGKRTDKGEQGIWVDVFPYDNILNYNHFGFRAFELKIIRGIIRAKCGYQTWKTDNGIVLSKYIKNMPFRLAAFFLDKDWLIKKYESISMKDNEEECEFVFENGTENYIKWSFPKKYFTDIILVDFEDYKMSVPKKYKEYLSEAYGDFMKLPPVEERENRHLIIKVDFGEDN